MSNYIYLYRYAIVTLLTELSVSVGARVTALAESPDRPLSLRVMTLLNALRLQALRKLFHQLPLHDHDLSSASACVQPSGNVSGPEKTPETEEELRLVIRAFSPSYSLRNLVLEGSFNRRNVDPSA